MASSIGPASLSTVVRRHRAHMNSNTTPLTRLLRRKTWAEVLLLACAVFAFAWIPPALILIFGDRELRPVFRTLWQLWPLAAVPLCGFAVSWRWRSSLTRKLRELDSHDAA